MRVIFMGSPDFAVPALDALIDLELEIVGVYCKAPRPAGRRGLGLTKTPIHSRAEALGLRVLTPATLRTAEAQEEFRNLGADAAVVSAYGLILPPPILQAPNLGCLNLHASLLPRWRGAAPIQRAIMAGDAETGIGLMRMEEGLDTGPVAREARAPISRAGHGRRFDTRPVGVGRAAADRMLGRFRGPPIDFSSPARGGNFLRAQNRQERNSDRLVG